MKRGLMLVLALVCVALPAHSLACGHLAPFSPWVVGFEHRDFERARVYYHPGADLSLLDDIDRIVAEVEASHGMRFLRKAELVVAASEAEHRRLASTGARFCVLPVYARLYVSKRAMDDAKAGRIHLDVYLRHELSHSLLMQHMTMLSALRCPSWLLEGLAVYTSRQRGCDGYLTRDEVSAKMNEGYFLHPSDFAPGPLHSARAMKAFPLPNKYWFLYAEMACLIDDLIQVCGQDLFNAFLDGVLHGENADSGFTRIYGESFDAYVDGFRKRMLASKPAAESPSAALLRPSQCKERG